MILIADINNWLGSLFCSNPLNLQTPAPPSPFPAAAFALLFSLSCPATTWPLQNINQSGWSMLHHLALQLSFLYFHSSNQLIVLQPPKPLPSHPADFSLNVNQISSQTTCETHKRTERNPLLQRCYCTELTALQDKTTTQLHRWP